MSQFEYLLPTQSGLGDKEFLVSMSLSSCLKPGATCKSSNVEGRGQVGVGAISA
jgi:hypothetical protein